MTAAVDLNADLGEGAATDEALLAIITSANIACGGHAGDEETMRRAVRLARARDVGVGAHPSYPDREGFGRRVIPMPLEQLTEILAGQIQVLSDIAEAEEVRLQHVKAHGALYNLAVGDETVADAIGRAMLRVDPALIAVALASLSAPDRKGNGDKPGDRGVELNRGARLRSQRALEDRTPSAHLPD